MAAEQYREILDILLVEDDRDIREVLAQLLEYSGCRVRPAADGEEALALLRGGFRPDVILLNLYMPRMNGWSFRAEQLQDARLAHIPVVLVSGMEGLEAEGHLQGAAAVHRKPVVLPELLRTLDTFRRAAPEDG